MIEFNEDTIIYTSEGEYQNVEGKSAEHIYLDEFKGIRLKTWVCKVCNIDNLGVICSECKKVYNQADPDCFLK